MRNKLAGKFKGTSKSAKYFAQNPEAREKKNAYNKKYHSTPERRKYRSKLNAVNRSNGGFGDGMDASHTSDGRIIKESASTNRARNGRGGTKRLK